MHNEHEYPKNSNGSNKIDSTPNRFFQTTLNK